MTRTAILALTAAVLLLGSVPALAVQHKAVHRGATRIGADYTTALNVLYSHGWRSVTSLSEEKGVVHASATNPEGKQATAQINVRARTLRAD